MAKTDPFLLNQHLKHSEFKCNTGLIVLWCGSYGWQLELIAPADLEASEGAVVAVQQQHGQRGELSRSIPAVAAVNHHWMSTGNFISHLDRPRQHQLPSQSKHQKKQLFTWTEAQMWGNCTPKTSRAKMYLHVF